MKIFSAVDLSHVNSNRKQQQDKMIVLSRADIIIGTVWHQESRKKMSIRTSSKSEVMEKREANTSIN